MLIRFRLYNVGKTNKKIIILTLLCIMLMPTVVFAKTNNEEKVVKVGYVEAPTYEEGKDGEYKTGSGYEYLQKISYL